MNSLHRPFLVQLLPLQPVDSGTGLNPLQPGQVPGDGGQTLPGPRPDRLLSVCDAVACGLRGAAPGRDGAGIAGVI